MLKDRRLILISLVGLGLAVNFWAGSRVPALNDKAMMGGDTQLEALGFETVLTVNPDDPALKRAAFSTVNWLETNRKGMTFGVLFGAVLLSLIGILKKKSFKNRFANSALGMGIGVPLGVCVNCAAPIAQGMRSAGARAETMLSTMISSPTLNVIVLTMLFALFPLYMVVIKLGLSLVIILVAVPIITRLMVKEEDVVVEAPVDEDGEACEIPVVEPAYGWKDSFVWLVKDYAKSLWYVARKTVPLMFLAGALGSLLITFLPWDSIATIIPDGTRFARLASIGLVAMVGLFLPVPITFDIILPAILLAGGMPIRLVMTLLFTLGIFSVYAGFITWQSLPKKVTVALAGVLLIFGVTSGLAGNRWAAIDEERREQLLWAEFEAGKDPQPSQIEYRGGTPETDESTLVAGLAATTPVPTWERSFTNELRVVGFAYTDRGDVSEPRFEKLEGGEIGLDAPYAYTVMTFVEPGSFRGIASGDVHGDGWPDIALASYDGPALFANVGDGTFVRQGIDLPELSQFIVVNVALVDLDNDGWLDLFVSTYEDGNYVVYNRAGEFTGAMIEKLPNQPDAMLSAATAFADVDRDGDLDIALGNWSHDGIRLIPETSPASRNVLLLREGDGWEMVELPGLPGGTLSALFSDFSGDGIVDLAFANDFGVPDHFFVGDGAGGLEIVGRNGIISRTGYSSMSIHTADLNNDLSPEMYIGHISGRDGGTDLPMEGTGEVECDDFDSADQIERCQAVMAIHVPITESRRRIDVRACLPLGNFADDCLATHVFLMAGARRDPSLCDMYPDGWERYRDVCIKAANVVGKGTVPEGMADDLPIQIGGMNVLLSMSEDGVLEDVAEEYGVGVGGWTWNAKFADLTNNGLQDLYIANGTFSGAIREPNLLYLHESMGSFVDRTEDLGLDAYMPSGSYTYVDLDRDGDLDIVMAPAIGPLLVYRNDYARGNSISFELDDHVGNRSGFGSHVVIHYGPNGDSSQMRELQAGGGFISFDAPLAHFGIGDADAVQRVEVLWSTGERSELDGRFEAGHTYVISRGAPQEVEATAIEAATQQQ